MLAVHGANDLQHNDQSILFRFPTEIYDTILEMVVTEDVPIEPVQLRDRSNKFTWSMQLRGHMYRPFGYEFGAVPHLTAVLLSKVCKKLYDDVAGTHLFYRKNKFQFKDDKSLQTYFSAITTQRLKAIRSVSYDWGRSYYTKHKVALSLNALAACDGLQNLELTFHVTSLTRGQPSTPLTDPSGVHDFGTFLKIVPGLMNITFAITNHYPYIRGADIQGFKSLIEQMESQTKVAAKKPQKERVFSAQKFQQMLESVPLDVHGEGRLGEDRKPNIVATRTRLQTRLKEEVKDDGTIPERARAKYDLNGDFSWCVRKVQDSRIIVAKDGTPSVEFQVLSESGLLVGRSGLLVPNHAAVAETSWEDVSILTDCNARLEIVSYFRKDKDQDGRDFVFNLWTKTLGEDDRYVLLLRTVVRAAEREAKRKADREAHEAQKAAEQAAKRRAKAAKAATRSKAANSKVIGSKVTKSKSRARN